MRFDKNAMEDLGLDMNDYREAMQEENDPIENIIKCPICGKHFDNGGDNNKIVCSARACLTTNYYNQIAHANRERLKRNMG